MAFPPKQLLPYLCAILLPSIMFFFFPHANAQRCKIPDSNQDRLRINYNMEDVSSGLYGIDNETVLSTIAGGQAIRLWQICPASFSVTIFYQQLSNQSGLAFLLLPLWGDDASLLIKQLADIDVATLKFSDSTYRRDPVSGSSVSVRTGVLHSIWNHGSSIMIVDINIHPPAAAGPSNYAVWIDYVRVGGILSVYVEAEGKTKPEIAIAEVHLNIYSVNSSYVRFGLLCAAEQFSNSNVDRLHWNATIDDLSYNYIDNTHNKDIRKVAVLCSVLGSIVATAVMAVAMALYLNSRHRQWRKDLDQLARSMECLPGVPTKIDFSDIKKATGNFHEAMKLGGGGYGTVYRCTLPFAASNSKTERPMDVAVKRFTRDVQERRYDDFLAEVSIINRLRHKNIVPLVGWSYNKGEPLLVFEFMTNGSLEQHLFPKCGRGTGQQREGHTGAAIRQWATRYDIVKDITTGLHYVHHEYEPMVLHRDIKASNVLLDSSFRARLGDFGLACTVAIDRNSTTGVAGTWGYIAPEYAMCGKATRYTDIYALGVLILEIVTGQRPLIHRAVDDDDVHITDRVWRLHCEGRLLECVDSMLISTYCRDDEQLGVEDDIERLLLLGLACSNPNPSDRPTMPEVMQIISKAVPPPEVPLMKPSFVWPPPEGVASEQDYSTGTSMTSNLGRSMAGMDEPQSQVSSGQSAAYARTVGGHTSSQLDHSIYVTAATALGSGEIRSAT